MIVALHVHQLVWQYKATSFLGWMTVRLGPAGVDMFFVVSGFVMALSIRSGNVSALQFLRRRAVRIIPAYWLYSFVFAALLVGIPSLQRAPFRIDGSQLLLSLSFLTCAIPDRFFPVLTVGWSLNFEMLFYGLLAFGLVASRVSRRPQLETWLVPSVILLLVIAYPWRLPGALMLRNHVMLTFVMGFVLGSCFLRGVLPLKPATGLPLVGTGILGLLLVEVDATIGVGASCTLVVWGFLCLESRLGDARPLLMLGDWSYSTYLVHVPVLVIARHMLQSERQVPVELVLPLSIVAILLLSAISYRFVERPSAAWFSARREAVGA